MEDDFEIGGESRSFVSPVALRRERQRHIDSSGLQTSSTQDDPELGIEMYRMSDPPVSPTSTTLPGPRLPAAAENLVRSALESSSTLSLISHEHGPPLVPMPKASGVNSQTVPAQTHIRALPNDVPEISSEIDGISETSAECLFAFPGIYQETLAQWSKEGKVSQSSDHDLPSNQEFEDHSRIEQTNDTIRPSSSGLFATPQSSTLAQEGAQLLSGDTSSDLEIPDGPPEEGSPSSERSTTYEPILGAAPMTGDFLPLLSPQSHSHIAGYGTFPFVPPASLPHDLGPQGNVLGVRCSGCENPLFTPANSTSPDWTSTEITSRMSISSNPWSNQWSPINSNLYTTSPTADQNEFFLVDGKTNSHHPDRGDQPVKTTHRIGKDDNMKSAALAQNQDVISAPRNPVGRDLHGQIDFEDEFTDDEFYPGGCTLPTKYY
ncbi:uncharacterized protein N7506_000351 [Penicillium brevicompactum]|uniref:uncharacterized protein n=1 Tax=Penicillium brevicompactum TaxID=5074 RepID=UPI002541DA65|nr:uncharacterized protein N7506_000351 [Penicillium brevicompactum]KAJ5347098.1 hypothetical protein N7506_000351 [Penicillium brevicompactum]